MYVYVYVYIYIYIFVLSLIRAMSFSSYDINYCLILNTLQVGNSGEGRRVLNFPIYSTEVSWYRINFVWM